MPAAPRPAAAAALALVAASALALPGVASAEGLEIGQPAPELKVATWVNGSAFQLADMRGKIVVVEFWATWCPPCRTSIPHLDNLQERLKDKGVVIVGVSDEDLDTVKPFHAANKTMRYHVAVDADRATSAAYMEAAGIDGIPHAFVVDKEGNLAWHGHPMDGLDRVLDEMVAGTFDRARIAELKKLQDAFQAVAEGLGSEDDLPKLLPPLDALIAADGKNARHYEIKVEVLSRIGRESEVPAVWVQYGDSCGDDVSTLTTVAAKLSTAENLLMRDLEAAKRFAVKAVALSKNDAYQATIAHSTLARVEYALGRIDQAIHHQELAVAKVDDDVPMRKVLDFYRRVKSHGAKSE